MIIDRTTYEFYTIQHTFGKTSQIWIFSNFNNIASIACKAATNFDGEYGFSDEDVALYWVRIIRDDPKNENCRFRVVKVHKTRKVEAVTEEPLLWIEGAPKEPGLYWLQRDHEKVTMLVLVTEITGNRISAIDPESITMVDCVFSDILRHARTKINPAPMTP